VARVTEWAYLYNVFGRRSVITILSNYACDVAQRGARRLYFNCGGLVVTAMFALGSAVSAISVVAFVLLVQAGGDAQRGLLGSLMGLSLAVWSAHLAIGRYQRHGSFELDGDEGVLRRFRAGRMTGEFDLSQITRVWITVDATDGMRLDGPPSWLQVLLDSGEVFRLAKGSRQELRPVCEAMRRLGVGAMPMPAA
jgi:hypothetical protein